MKQDGHNDGFGDPTRDMLESINRARAAVSGFGGPPLTMEPRLTAAAVHHCTYLAADDRLDHVDDQGRDGPMRVTAFGYHWSVAGETIARGQPSAIEVVNAWIESPGHREVLLNPQYVHVGLAFVADTRPSTAWPTYWVAVFAAPLHR